MTDVCLILEETYPYALGGVSTWVHSLVTGLPEIKFHLIHISADSRKRRRPRFDLPSNLEEVTEVRVDLRGGWDRVLGRLARDLTIPESRIYHALSTGLAGMAGVRIKQATQRPFLLTEHGIYWKEIELGTRELETGFRIATAADDHAFDCAARESWTERFKELSRIAYSHADEVVTVCQANHMLQLACGAFEEKCSVIPNGVEVPLDPCRASKRHCAGGRFRIGFIGRIVPIKDVKTLIRACSIVTTKRRDTELLLIGPTSADRRYYRECQALASEVRPAPRLTFVGTADPRDYFPTLDVVALTSISEGQPLALLEAMSHGLPVVTSNVGGCPDLVLGAEERDSAMGAAGIVVPPEDAQATANAILRIAGDARLARAMSRAARLRIQTLYTRNQFLQGYGGLYARYVPAGVCPPRRFNRRQNGHCSPCPREEGA